MLATTAAVTLVGGAPAGATVTATILSGPSGSVKFGERVEVLPNGNFVVHDTAFQQNIGAVYLYDGVTRAMISVLTGTLPDDAVGRFGITVLPDGNFLVRSPDWSNGAVAKVGAVTWVNGTTGLNGRVSPSNSLHGTTADDRVGSDGVSSTGNDILPL